MTLLVAGVDTPVIPVHRRNADLWIEWIDTPAALVEYVESWSDLAAHAVEPNPFYEPWSLLPAWKHLARQTRIRVALVFRHGPEPQSSPELCGLFPIAEARFGRWPVRVWRMWQHLYCFACTPLIRRDAVVETLEAFWGALRRDRQHAGLWELSHVPGDGPFHQALVELRATHEISTHTVMTYNRALLRPMKSADAYCAATMTNHNRQELRRQRRRLGEQGRVEFRTFTEPHDIRRGVEQFLTLEAAGWKGRNASAFQFDAEHRDYFLEIAADAAARRQIAVLGLYLDERPLALKINFLSGAGAFAFKIAFDESYAKFSPGVQLEVENVAWAHRQEGLEWMDSCAQAGHFMIGRLWHERRTIQHVLLSTGHLSGELTLGLMPLLRVMKAFVHRPPRKARSSLHHSPKARS